MGGGCRLPATFAELSGENLTGPTMPDETIHDQLAPSSATGAHLGYGSKRLQN